MSDSPVLLGVILFAFGFAALLWGDTSTISGGMWALVCVSFIALFGGFLVCIVAGAALSEPDIGALFFIPAGVTIVAIQWAFADYGWGWVALGGGIAIAIALAIGVLFEALD